MPFKLNCGYYPWVSYEEEIDLCSKSKSADKLSAKLRELMTVCQENLHHAQELQKRAHDKGVKPKSYAPSDKVWLNRKYLKTKWNRKFEAKFFGPFRVLHSVGRQSYKLKLPKKWRVHDVFDVSLLEQDPIRKERVDKKVTELDFEAWNSEEYKVEVIWNSAVYVNKSKSSHLPGLDYLIAWKGYPEEENTWEPFSAIQHLQNLISSFHKNHLEKPTATSPPIDFAPPMTRPTVKATAKTITKQKWGRPANSVKKQAKNWTHTDSRNHQPLISRGLDGFSLFAKFVIFLKLIYKSIRFSPQSHPIRLGGFYWRPSIKQFFSSLDFPFSVPNGLEGFFY